MTSRPAHESLPAREPSGPRPAEPVFELVLAAAAVGLGVVRPIVQGRDPVAVVLTFVVGVVLVVACGLLPRRVRVPGAAIVVVAGIVVLALTEVAESAYATWAFACVMGGILALHLVPRTRRGARP